MGKLFLFDSTYREVENNVCFFLTVYWRWSENTGASKTQPEVDDILANATEDELYDTEFYITKIPIEEKAIDSIKSERNEAYYQLGLIYKEKFKEYECKNL